MACVKELIDGGADVNELDEDGDTPLIWAIEDEDEEFITEFIRAGCDVNKTNTLGFTALMVASTSGFVNITKKLIKSGADVNLENNANETAIFLAIQKGHKYFKWEKQQKDIRNDQKDAEKSSVEDYCRTVHELLKAGARLRSTGMESNPCTAHLSAGELHCESITAMLYAAGGRMEDQERIEKMLQIKDNINLSHLSRKVVRKQLLIAHHSENLYFTISKLGVPSRLQSLLLFNQTYGQVSGEEELSADEETLLDSSRRGNVQSLELLLKSKMNVDVPDQSGNTALMLAAQGGHHECLQSLVNAGANVDLTNLQLDTALHFAVQSKDIHCVESLIEAGCDVNVQNQAGQTPLMKAADHRDYNPTAEQLIAANSEINLKDKDGFTALDKSVSNHNQMTHLLIHNGADVNSTSDSGSTALFHAAKVGSSYTVEKLIIAGANPDIQDKNCTSPLHEAITYESSQCVEELLNAGVDVNVQNKDGGTPLMQACWKNTLETVQDLIQAGADVNKQDEAGNTALIITINNKEEDCLKELIKSGADLNMKNKEGWTAMSSAWQRENYCRILWEAGAEVDTAWLTTLVYERYRLQTDVYFKKRIRFDFQLLFRNLVSMESQRTFDGNSKFLR